MGKHTERCPRCKSAFHQLLSRAYGVVQQNCRLDVSCRLEDVLTEPNGPVLGAIHQALVANRGYARFVGAARLSPVDFFIDGPRKRIVEFDESQHFTKPRALTLSMYPDSLCFGFPVEQWERQCMALNRRDNDPPHRDEQRAWYDTLRDFVPFARGWLPTARVNASEKVWCSMDPERDEDLEGFIDIIERRQPLTGASR